MLPSALQELWTPALHMPWCLPAIEASGLAPPRFRGLLQGQGSMACLLVTLRCTRQSLTLILHGLAPVSPASSHMKILLVLLNLRNTERTMSVFLLCFRFTNHAYQYASTPLATSAPLGCLHSYNPHPQCLECSSATLTHSLPRARPGRKLPLLATGALSRLGYHETPPAEDYPAGTQRAC